MRGDATGHDEHAKEGILTRSYRAVMDPMIHHVWARWLFLVVITLLLVGSMALVATRHVQVKMLPFDNKSEF